MAISKRVCVVLVAILLVSQQFASAEELPTVERASFPKDFVFGTATAAYQYEGAATEGGKGLSIWDTFTHRPGVIAGNTTGDIAVDQYHRYAEDLWLLKDLNMDAYRFSISWSRIFPKGVGEVNWEGVKYYDMLIKHLLELNIEPYITLYHWDMPQALEDSIGGWLSPDIVDAFTRYARFCFERWGPRVKYWITFNEIHSFANAGYSSGEHAPGRCTPPKCSAGNSNTEPYIVSHHALLSHAHTVDMYRKEFKDAQKGVIGITTDCTWYTPLNSSSNSDQRAAQEAIEGFLGWYLDPIFFGDYPASMRASLGSNLPTFTPKQVELIKGSQDFVGINHYSSMYATFNETNGEIIKTGYKDGVPIGGVTPSDWLFVAPSGMRKLLGWVRERYNNPIVYVTENGRDESNKDESLPLADQLKDPERIEYYHDYLQNVLLAIK
ncbi:hypothetical protein M758_3G065000 [Ceratodon purpureus]|nr:hypothetical protein M758_3G065000 [Ceratodon purpureus]KAG0622013.1 hypothetical protein M758_3G065000 [Ceratodon purpureus]KAG0622021.1 hypothetical protein M758_3G065000 [Ceratodon purpureus]